MPDTNPTFRIRLTIKDGKTVASSFGISPPEHVHNGRVTVQLSGAVEAMGLADGDWLFNCQATDDDGNGVKVVGMFGPLDTAEDTADSSPAADAKADALDLIVDASPDLREDDTPSHVVKFVNKQLRESRDRHEGDIKAHDITERLKAKVYPIMKESPKLFGLSKDEVYHLDNFEIGGCEVRAIGTSLVCVLDGSVRRARINGREIGGRSENLAKVRADKLSDEVDPHDFAQDVADGLRLLLFDDVAADLPLQIRVELQQLRMIAMDLGGGK